MTSIDEAAQLAAFEALTAAFVWPALERILGERERHRLALTGRDRRELERLQRRAPAQAHRHAERVLMGRRHERRRRVRRQDPAALDIESLLVHRDPGHARAPARGDLSAREGGCP